jgi:hypothetical protein
MQSTGDQSAGDHLTITEIASAVESRDNDNNNIVNANYNMNRAGVPPTIGVVVAAANYTK